MPREASILTRTRQHLYHAANVGAHFIKTTRDGEPDLVGSLDGRAVVCETKQPGEKPEPLQRERLRQWSKTGAVALWTDGKSYLQVTPEGNYVEIAGFDAFALRIALDRMSAR